MARTAQVLAGASLCQGLLAESFGVSDDGRVWTIRLRDGLRWHDGEPVLARDCTASFQRWSKRDTFGQSLARLVDEWGIADDRMIQIKLKSPFPLLPVALGKISSATVGRHLTLRISWQRQFATST